MSCERTSHLNGTRLSALKSVLAVRQAQAPSKVEGMQGPRERGTGDVRSWVLRGSRATENPAIGGTDDVRMNIALGWDAIIGALEWVSSSTGSGSGECKARVPREP